MATASGGAGVGGCPVELRQRDVLLVDGHAETPRDEADAGRKPGLLRDDSHGSVPRNGTEGLGGRCDCIAEVVRRVHASQPSSGRTIWVAATITSQAIGTAAKNPSAALQPLRRRTVPGAGRLRDDEPGDDAPDDEDGQGVDRRWPARAGRRRAGPRHGPGRRRRRRTGAASTTAMTRLARTARTTGRGALRNCRQRTSAQPRWRTGASRAGRRSTVIRPRAASASDGVGPSPACARRAVDACRPPDPARPPT